MWRHSSHLLTILIGILAVTTLLPLPAHAFHDGSPHGFLIAAAASSAVFKGGGLQEGVTQARDIQGLSKKSLPTIITGAIGAIVNILGLLAAAALIISGTMFVVSAGNEEMRTKAKNAAIYAVVGLLVVLFAKAIITFVLFIG